MEMLETVQSETSPNADVSDESQSARESRLPLTETVSTGENNDDNKNQNELDDEKEKKKLAKYKKIVILRILARLFMVAVMVTIIVVLGLNINAYLSDVLDGTYQAFGNEYIAAFVFTIIFSVWTSLSPMGYLPTVLCGLFFSWWLAPICAYISVNIGSFFNILLIRYVILRNQDNCCIKHLLRILCGKKHGQISVLKKLFNSSDNPVKIIVLLRLPYLNNGVLNYVFSLQIDTLSIGQCVIGNSIGFIPGAIIFSIFGSEIKSVIKIITQKGFDSTKQMVLFLSVSIVTIVCYAAVVYKVRKVIKDARKKQQESAGIDNENNEMDVEIDET